MLIKFCIHCFSSVAVEIPAAKAAVEKNAVVLAVTRACVVLRNACVEPKRQAARTKILVQ